MPAAHSIGLYNRHTRVFKKSPVLIRVSTEYQVPLRWIKCHKRKRKNRNGRFWYKERPLHVFFSDFTDKNQHFNACQRDIETCIPFHYPWISCSILLLNAFQQKFVLDDKCVTTSGDLTTPLLMNHSETILFLQDVNTLCGI